MQKKIFSDDLYGILNRATQQSSKYYQTFCGTQHLFLAMFSFLSNNKETERYSQVYNNLKTIMNKYNVTGKAFEQSFLSYFPAGTEPDEGETVTIAVNEEYNKVVQVLQRAAVKFQRSTEVEDLIMALFEDKSYDIFTIFSDIIGSDNKTDEMYNEIIKAFKPAVTPEIKELEQLSELTNLNKWLAKSPRTVIAADEPVMKIEMALAGRSTRNCILTGRAGTGKTEYVYEFVQRIIKGNVPSDFKNKIVYQLDTGALVAGTRYRGDLEEKLQNILQIVKEHPEIILFIDEIHSFLGAGGGGDDSGNSCGQLIKPYISRGEIQLIGCTTNEEYTKFIKKDHAFERRFHEIKISEPTRDQTRQILEGLLPVETKYFNKDMQMTLVERILDLSETYSLDLANPAKSINMLEVAFAYSKVFQEQNTEVDINDVIQSVKLKYNVYISKDKLAQTEKELHSYILGQEPALNQVVKNLKIVSRGIVDQTKPMMSMLLCGPTGTGKTETAKIIAKYFFGSEENLVKVNMGEYSTEQDVSKISGSAPGLVGYDEEPALIKQVREKPNSLILFDEIEKAHKSIQKIILNILDEGEMRDNKGNRVSFRNCIIMFTTNLGCNKDTGKATGMGMIKTIQGQEKSDIMKAIENYFSPEFLGRLDDIVFYNILPESIIEQLINRYLDEYKNQCVNLDVKFTPEDIKEIIKNSDITTRGARGVKKAVKKQIILVEERMATETPAEVKPEESVADMF